MTHWPRHGRKLYLQLNWPVAVAVSSLNSKNDYLKIYAWGIWLIMLLAASASFHCIRRIFSFYIFSAFSALFDIKRGLCHDLFFMSGGNTFAGNGTIVQEMYKYVHYFFFVLVCLISVYFLTWRELSSLNRYTMYVQHTGIWEHWNDDQGNKGHFQ